MRPTGENPQSARHPGEFGCVTSRAPRKAAFKSALADEVQRLQAFLRLQ